MLFKVEAILGTDPVAEVELVEDEAGLFEAGVLLLEGLVDVLPAEERSLRLEESFLLQSHLPLLFFLDILENS